MLEKQRLQPLPPPPPPPPPLRSRALLSQCNSFSSQHCLRLLAIGLCHAWSQPRHQHCSCLLHVSTAGLKPARCSLCVCVCPSRWCTSQKLTHLLGSCCRWCGGCRHAASLLPSGSRLAGPARGIRGISCSCSKPLSKDDTQDKSMTGCLAAAHGRACCTGHASARTHAAEQLPSNLGLLSLDGMQAKHFPG